MSCRLGWGLGVAATVAAWAASVPAAAGPAVPLAARAAHAQQAADPRPDGARARDEAAAERAVARARARLGDGDPADAERVLEEAAEALGNSPVRVVVDAARGELAFLRGRPGRAAALLRPRALLPGPDPRGRTRAIELLGAIERADSSEAAIVGAHLLRLARDPGRARAAGLLSALEAVPASEGRPALLALAARELDAAGQGPVAAGLRRHLVEHHPDAPESPAAMLELGREARDRSPEEAETWLERLLLSHPQSAVAPIARRLLAELRDRVPGP